MKKTGPSLDWCVVRLGNEENWWVESISDKENWDVDDLSIIDPKQFLHISELLDSMTEFGLDSQLVDEAFFTFEISEELDGGLIKLVRVRDSLLKAVELLFALPDVLDEEKGQSVSHKAGPGARSRFGGGVAFICGWWVNLHTLIKVEPEEPELQVEEG